MRIHKARRDKMRLDIIRRERQNKSRCDYGREMKKYEKEEPIEEIKCEMMR